MRAGEVKQVDVVVPGEMTNYRVKDQTYIMDRLFDRANLVLGSGKKAQKVEITRGTKG